MQQNQCVIQSEEFQANNLGHGSKEGSISFNTGM